MGVGMRWISLEVSWGKGCCVLEVLDIRGSSCWWLGMVEEWGEENGMDNKSIYVGIDDFGYKKGKDYMSVVVEEMREIGIGLLEDRKGEGVDKWVMGNGEIEYIRREGGRCLREGIKRIIGGVREMWEGLDVMKNMRERMIGEIEKIMGERKKKVK